METLPRQPRESHPLYTTSLDDLPARLTVRHIAAIVHRASGTLSDVSLHPRGCGACEKAVNVAGLLGLEIPPLYADELPADVIEYTDHNGDRHEWSWRESRWIRMSIGGAAIPEDGPDA
jgi:hypothetical protein